MPQVVTTPDRLTISLKWYGRVLDGQLHLRVKPSETHWCLEDSEVGRLRLLGCWAAASTAGLPLRLRRNSCTPQGCWRQLS